MRETKTATSYPALLALIDHQLKRRQDTKRKLSAIKIPHIGCIHGDVLYELIKHLYSAGPNSIYFLSETCFGMYHLINNRYQLLAHRKIYLCRPPHTLIMGVEIKEHPDDSIKATAKHVNGTHKYTQIYSAVYEPRTTPPLRLKI